MILRGTRFGEVEIDDAKVLSFGRGLVGFPDARRFVLLGPPPGRGVGWLQSIDRPALALPVVAAAGFEGYPDPAPGDLAREANLDPADVTILVVVAVDDQKRLVANLLAPIVVDRGSGAAVQAVLDPKRYSARAPLTAHAA